MNQGLDGFEQPPSGDGPLTVDEALQYADDFGPDWDGAALRALADEVRRLRAELDFWRTGATHDTHTSVLQLTK
jgi:hypothetical protein